MPGHQTLLTGLDGALIYPQDCIYDTLLAASQTVNKITSPKERIMGMFGLPAEVMLITLTDMSPDDKETIAGFIGEYKRQYPVHMERARLIDRALETVEYIEGLGYLACLITSERRKGVAHISGRIGLGRYIWFMITRNDMTCFRPDPESILKGIIAYGTVPKDCMYIGEPLFDIETEVAAGVFTVAVPSGNWPADSLVEQSPNYMVKDIIESCSISDEPQRRRTI